MSNMEKWNKIVQLHKDYKTSGDELNRKIWENIFSEFFGYSKLFNEIESQRIAKVGVTRLTINDIIIKQQTNDVFMTKIKQKAQKEDIIQVLSYLEILNMRVGLIVSDKITIILYDYLKKSNEQSKYDIEFVQDSNEGESFIDIFAKPFNFNKLNEFINNANSIRRKQQIKDIITKINREYIKELIIAELRKSYDLSVINDALDEINILKEDNSLIVVPKNDDDENEIIDEDEDIIIERIKIGKAVQRFFSKASINNSLSSEIIGKLCDYTYCNKTFRMRYEILREIKYINDVEDLRKDHNGYDRYYAKVYLFNNKKYLLCSQWYIEQEKYFYMWKNHFGGIV